MKGYVQRVGTLAGVALCVNVVWEFAHARLYAMYQGGEITSGILLRAALGDMVMLTVIAAIAGMMRRDVAWCHALAGAILALMVAFNLELWALSVGRWAYLPSMPTLSFFGVGLSPLVQLPASIVVMWLFQRRAFFRRIAMRHGE